MKVAGHTFLAKLGKKKLRPGGVKGTNFLFKNAEITKDSLVLEVACNMATSAIKIAKKYKCKMVICDLDENVLKIAEANVKKAKLEDKIKIVKADAKNLPFDNEMFDVVINEAMLTMLSDVNKQKAVSEYFRVLKKGGRLATHDVLLFSEDIETQKNIKAELSRAINVHASPFTNNGWRNLFLENGFSKVINNFGKMSLMNPIGMIRDEGFFNTIRIIRRGLKRENKQQFKTMFNVFKKHKNNLGYFVAVSVKE